LAAQDPGSELPAIPQKLAERSALGRTAFVPSIPASTLVNFS
jgi:hypothetical protein